jgi:DNA repair exonuclease SbcCD ATPase subunit
MIGATAMKNNISPVEKARRELETAEETLVQAQAAVRDFCTPFTQKELSLKCEISDEQQNLISLRRRLAEVLDDSVKAEEVETQIEKSEKLLKRLQARLQIAGSWRGREKALKELEDAEQNSLFEYKTAYEHLMARWREHVLEARQNYLQTLVDFWQRAREASGHVTIPKFSSTELEISWDFIRQQTGAMW